MVNNSQQAHYVATVTELITALEISPTWFYRMRRLPDAPKWRKDGRWSVSKWRTFIRKHQPHIQGRTTEKAQLELALLKARLERQNFDLNESRSATRKAVLKELTAEFEWALEVLRSNLEKVRLELAPRFAGLDVKNIYNQWRARESLMFRDVLAELEGRTGATVKVKEARLTRVPSCNGNRSNGVRQAGVFV
jgi:hypothetical protein